MEQNHESRYDSCFYQLGYSGNSGNSTISVKGKDLTNVEKYVERKVFSKGKI